MTTRNDAPLPMAGSEEGAPAFAEPWHAQIFAITVELSEQGHFTWPEWVEVFGAALKQAAADGGPDDGSDYYDIWLEALERILKQRGLAAAEELSRLKQAWRDAYLNTPHGQPVRLD